VAAAANPGHLALISRDGAFGIRIVGIFGANFSPFHAMIPALINSADRDSRDVLAPIFLPIGLQILILKHRHAILPTVVTMGMEDV